MAALWIERVNSEDEGLVVLNLEGELAGEGLASLEAVCRLLVQGLGTLALDLAGLTYASPGGVSLLATLAAAGVELRNGSPLLVDLLNETRPPRLGR